MARKFQIDTSAQIGGILEAKGGASVTGNLTVSSNLTTEQSVTSSKGDFILSTDDKGISFFGGARIYKLLGSGLKIKAHTDSVGVAIRNAADTTDRLVVKTDGSATGLTYNTYTVWTAQNDGSGSGMDSDLIDGKHLSQLIQTDVATQTIDGGVNTTLNIVSDDTGQSVLNLYGGEQGTGILYVGQSSSHGGGIEYNGDNAPGTSGAGVDFVTLFRRSSGVTEWTARNLHSSNNWEFRGDVKAVTFTATSIGVGLTVGDGIDGQVKLGNTTLLSSGTSELQINTAHGYIQVGPKNTTYAHIYTDRPEFYFNKELRVNGSLVWNASNDGANSGLDSDLLDGLHETTFMRKSANSDLTFANIVDGVSNGIVWDGLTDTFKIFVEESASPIGGENTRWIFSMADNDGDGATFRHTQSSVSVDVLKIDRTRVDSNVKLYANSGLNVSGGDLGVTGNITVTGNVDGVDVSAFKAAYDTHHHDDSYVNVNGDIMTGALYITSGGNVLTLKAGSTQDHVYMSFFADSADQSTRSGYIGFGSAGSTGMTIANDMGGHVNILTTGNTNLKHNGNTVWTSANDGASSGMDADLLDGIQGSQYMRTDATNNTTSIINYTGGSGRVFQANITATGNVAPFTIQRSGVDKFFITIQDDNSVNLDSKGGVLLNNGNKIWTEGNDGSGSGLDADKFDGLESNQFLRNDLDATTTGNLTIANSLPTLNLRAGINQSSEIFFSEDGENHGIRLRYTGLDSNEFQIIGRNTGVETVGLTMGRAVGNSDLKYKGFTIWHSGNDGSGSTLDADLLDGLNGSSYMRTDANTSTSGTMTVGGTLTVGGDVVANGFALVLNNSGATNMDHLWHDDTNNIWHFVSDGAYKASGNSTLQFGAIYATGTGSHYIAGNLGLGVASPSQRLHVNGNGRIDGMLFLNNSAAQLNFQEAGTTKWHVESVGGHLKFVETNVLERLHLSPGGNVGIGSTSPSEKLHVGGAVKIDGKGSTIGGATMGNAHLLIGSTSAGIGIDDNEIYSSGSDLILGVIGSYKTIVKTGTTTILTLHSSKVAEFSGVIQSNNNAWQATFAAGTTKMTITHNFGTTSYMVALGANSVARHVAWENKGTNTVDIVLDSAYYDGTIIVDVILLRN